MAGDCVELMASLPEQSVDAIVTDPPYHLTQASRGGHARNNNPDSPNGRHRIGDKGFMGKVWDGGDFAFRVETWRAAWRVLKPGGHLVAFGGTRTFHRMVIAIEDAGFEIRDMGAWLYGNGFPKSENPCKCRPHVDSGAVDTRGWKLCGICCLPFEVGTALKPAHEPLCFARKPLIGTVLENLLAHGTGAINVEGCRVPHGEQVEGRWCNGTRPAGFGNVGAEKGGSEPCGQFNEAGRWPGNVMHDGSDDARSVFPDAPGQQRAVGPEHGAKPSIHVFGDFGPRHSCQPRVETDSSAARFFYCAKASQADRGEGNTHPTVKPTELMRYLVRLVTPPNGTVLDMFAGSGSTGKACVLEGFHFIGMDLDPAHIEIAQRRINSARDDGATIHRPTARRTKMESSAAQEMLPFADSAGNVALPFNI